MDIRYFEVYTKSFLRADIGPMFGVSEFLFGRLRPRAMTDLSSFYGFDRHQMELPRSRSVAVRGQRSCIVLFLACHTSSHTHARLPVFINAFGHTRTHGPRKTRKR